jgi:predicted dehydrogenase
MKHKAIGRREFMGGLAVGAAAMLVDPSKVLGANDRVRVGMIGAGGRGQELLKWVTSVPNVEVVAIADIYRRRYDEAKHIVPTLQTFDDHRRLLDVRDIDAVLIASPLHMHAPHLLDTLAAGKDAYCEKTMTWSIGEADQCLKAAKNSKQVVTIGLQHESSGALADAKQWINQGLPGKVTQVEAWMSRNTPHGQGQWVRSVPGDCSAGNVRWDAFLNGRPARSFDAYKFINWRLFWEFSGGNVTENMVHQIAWITTALGLDLPASAYMSGGVFSEKDGREVPDTIAVTLNYPNDVVVLWQSVFNNAHYGLGERFLGSDGTIEHLMGVTDMVTGKSASTIHLYPEKINRPNGAALTGESPDQNHMANFIDCVRSRKQPNAPIDIGYRSAVAGHMANLAYRTRKVVTLDEARALPPNNGTDVAKSHS